MLVSFPPYSSNILKRLLICRLIIVIADSPTGEPSSFSKSTKAIQFNESEAGVSSLIYSYEQLRVDSRNPVIGIDVTKREVSPVAFILEYLA